MSSANENVSSFTQQELTAILKTAKSPPMPPIIENFTEAESSSLSHRGIVTFDLGSQTETVTNRLSSAAKQEITVSNPQPGQMPLGPDGSPVSEESNMEEGMSSIGEVGSIVANATQPFPIVNTLANPWYKIFKLLMRFNVGGTDYYYACSAFSAGSFHLLTAGNCIYNHDPNNDGNTSDAKWADDVWAWTAQTDRVDPIGVPDHPWGISEAVMLRSYAGWTQHSNFDHDWGVITLDRRRAERSGWMGRESNVTTTDLNIGGYPVETPYVPADNFFQYHGFDANNVAGYTTFRINLNAFVFGGHQGGPSYRFDGTSRFVQGIHSTSNRVGEATDTRLTSGKLSDINTFIADDESIRPPTARPELIEHVFSTGWKGLFSNTVIQGNTFETDINAFNTGFASNGSVTIDFYLSTDSIITTDDRKVETWSFAGLNGNTVTGAEKTFTAPSDLAPGTYYFGWIMSSAVPEYHTHDNTAVVTNETLTVLAPPCSLDSFEPDNSSVSASALNSGQTQNHSICQVGDQDWTTFTLTEPANVVLETSGPSGATEMTLYNSTFTPLDFSDNGGAGLLSRIDRVCGVDELAAGTYFVKVNEPGNNETIDSYDIDLTATSCSSLLSITPAGNYNLTGSVGGPFTPASKDYQITNNFIVPVDYSVASNGNWLTITNPTGTLTAGQSATVSVAPNATANSLLVGVHNDNLSFTNTTNGYGNATRPVALTVNVIVVPPVLSVTPGTNLVSSGPEGGPFSPETQAYTLTNTGDSDLNYSVGITQDGFTVAGNASSQEAGSLNLSAKKPGPDLSAKSLALSQQSSDRVIVKFVDGTAQTIANGVMQNSAANALATAGVALSQHFSNVGISVLNITEQNKPLDKILSELNDMDMVEYAEPDYTLQADVVPNDPQFNELWGLHNIGQSSGIVDADIDAPEAWNTNTGDSGIVVAVIDTGVDYNHVDLSANMWSNPGEIAGNGIDDDLNGYVDDIHGIDTANSDSDPMDDHSHGTHVSGTIGAVGNNGTGVVGVNWNVKILGCKFLSASGFGSTAGAIECLDYVLGLKNAGINVRLTNNSWGGGGFSQALSQAISDNGAAGILFVAAAGNAASNTDISPHYPSSYVLPTILSVASTDRNDNLSSFSNYGVTSVDLGAPGSSILSTIPGNGYGLKNGTSMAAPHVAGVAALVWAQNPALTLASLKTLIMNSTDPIPSLTGKTITGGRLNVSNALGCTPGTPVMLISSPTAGFAVPLSQSIVVSITLTDCGAGVTNATVSVAPSNGDPLFNLLDDGVFPDATANDGVYSGSWVPGNAGPVTLDITADNSGNILTDSVSGTAQKNYVFDDQVAFKWIDATTGTNTGMAGDDVSVNIPIGFNFDFYGVNQTSVTVSSNGYLTFGTSGTIVSNSNIPNSDQPNNLIAPFWDDLFITGPAGVYFLLEGTAPNRRLTIEWHSVPHIGQTGVVTFEVTLFEGSNFILFQYQDVVFGNAGIDNGASATVGIEDANGSMGRQFSFNNNLLSDQSAILFFLPFITVKDNGGGTLAGGASTTVDVTINQGANSLSPGSYSQSVVFANTTNGAGNTTRGINLTVMGDQVLNDFDGDNQSDILAEYTGGLLFPFLLKDSVLQNFGFIVQADPSLGWTLNATGDFNGDRKSDLLFYNTTTGEYRVVLLDGITVLSDTVVFTIDPVIGVEPRGVGDFDGDGENEIVIYHPSSGFTALVYLVGGVFSSFEGVTTVDVSNNWILKDTGHFNDDNKTDFFITNTVTGEAAVIEMDGSTPTGPTTVFVLDPATGWTIEEIADFTGNGSSDVSILHSTGSLGVLTMNGLVFQILYLPGGLLPTWDIVNTGHYNNDNKADFLIYDTVTGDLMTAVQDGAVITTFTPVLNLGPGSGWSYHGGKP